MTLRAGRQALFVQEHASNQGTFFDPQEVHPLYDHVFVKTALSPLDQLPPPQRERFFKPNEYNVLMTVLEEGVQYPRISAARLQQLLEGVVEPGTDLFRWQTFLDSTRFIEQTQMGGVFHYLVTEAGQTYYSQQMSKIGTWPAPLKKHELKGALETFGERIDQLSLPLSAEKQEIIAETGFQLLATAYALLGAYPWALIQQFYSLLLHPTSQGFVDWYSNYHIEMRVHLEHSPPPQPPQSTALNQETPATQEEDRITELFQRLIQDEEEESVDTVTQTEKPSEESLSEEERVKPPPPEQVFQRDPFSMFEGDEEE